MELDLLVVINIDLKLVRSFFVTSRPNTVSPFKYIYPTHAHHLVVNHKAQGLGKIALVCGRPERASVEIDSLLNVSPQLADIAR